MEEKKQRNKGSITVEASFVMITVLLTISACIEMSFNLHDKAVSKAVLAESVKLWTHRDPERNENLYMENEERLKNVFSRDIPVMSFEEKNFPESLTGTVKGKDFSFEMTAENLRPEKLLRTLALKDAFITEEVDNENQGE